MKVLDTVANYKLFPFRKCFLFLLDLAVMAVCTLLLGSVSVLESEHISMLF